jgi:hypothetical protein
MQLDLGLVADSANIDAQGKLYILGEFRYLFAASFPAVHPRLALALRISAPIVEIRDNTATLALEAVDEDGFPLLPKTPECRQCGT